MRIVTGRDPAENRRRGGAPRAERTRHVPRCETLEGRELMAAGQVNRRFLLTPIADTALLAEHIHPHLTIVINGKPQVIPAGIGIGRTGNLPIHTHTADGTLHVESTKRLPFKLKDFFTIWGQPFTKKVVLGHIAAGGKKITMTVDGRPSNQFGNLALQDAQQIIIRYG